MAVPAGPGGSTPALQVGAALGLVIGRTACRVAVADALAHVADAVIANDLSVPHDSYYRPSVRLKAGDGCCPIGSTVVPLAELPAPVDALGLRVFVDGVLVHHTSTGDRLRGAAQLLADVSEFMTLQPGDVLMLGVSLGAPLATAGQVVAVEIDGLGRLTTPLVAAAELAPAAGRVGAGPAAVGQGGAGPAAVGQGSPSPTSAGAARMPRQRSARVAYGGAVHGATPHPQGLRLDDGRLLVEADVVWLPPFEVGTIIALGLNYADRVNELSKELTITTQDEPLVFLKGPGSLIDHRGRHPPAGRRDLPALRVRAGGGARPHGAWRQGR